VLRSKNPSRMKKKRWRKKVDGRQETVGEAGMLYFKRGGKGTHEAGGNLGGEISSYVNSKVCQKG